MGDNYLEKKMEDMRSGKLSARVSPSARRKTLQGLRAFVTGGASGIGRGIVEELRRNGCRVSFCDKNSEKARKLASVYGADFYHVDVTDRELLHDTLLEVIDKEGDLDIIVNNVGVGNFKKFEDLTLSDFETVLHTNLFPVFITSHLLARHRQQLLESGAMNPYGGRIINICSTRHLQSEPGSEAYAASKGAIYSLSHALMASLSRYGITVNSISPGWINVSDTEQFAESDILQHPSQRIGEPGDISRLVAFICNPSNNFINGEDIVVDGGMTRKMIYSGDYGWEYTPEE